MAMSFIGKPISLISHSDVRYRGILAGIDPVASTIQLSNVYSMGTETRRPAEQYIPPVQEPYQYIIFKAGEVKDLAVDEPTMPPPAPRRDVHDDPAVMASAPLANYPPSYAPPAPQAAVAASPSLQQPVQQAPQPTQPSKAPQQQQQQQQARAIPPHQQQVPPAPPTAAQVVAGAPTEAAPRAPQQQQAGQIQQQQPPRRPNAVQTASASLETVQRALGDLQVSNNNNNNGQQHQQNRGGRRGGHRGPRADANGPDYKVPAADFDFASMNAKFDKAALAAAAAPRDTSGMGPLSAAAATPSGSAASAAVAAPVATSPEEDGKEKEKGPAAYNPSKSFFDTLSSNAVPEQGPRAGGGGGGYGGRGGRGGRGAGGRNRREEEREKNVATFGEPGGVGLMGPGAYVGGYGGHGRRGRGRGRGRGGYQGQGHMQQQGHGGQQQQQQQGQGQGIPARG